MSDEDDKEPRFDRDFSVAPGELVELSPLVRRMLANNPSPFTFKGTCSYIVGRGKVVIVDPGPDDPAHIEALLKALQHETILACVITHTHRDHSPAARAIKAATGADIIGCAQHHRSRDLIAGETGSLDAANDLDHQPDKVMQDGDVFDGYGFHLQTIATPGHTMNHLAFALAEEDVLFSGDHVMAWSTSIVSPPDGAMQPYMASLEKLLGFEHKAFWPGHGGAVREPKRFVRGLLHHRRMREEAIRNRLAAGDTSIATIVENIYKGLDPKLVRAASLSVLAHLESLCAEGKARCEGQPTLTSVYHST